MTYEIPLFGPPLAGKTSFLHAAASASGIRGRFVQSTLRTEDAFDGASIRIFEVEFPRGADTMRLWCVPGGCAPEWPRQFVTGPAAALFVADAQASRHSANTEHWNAVRDVVAMERWFAVLTKCDLASSEEQQHALPPELLPRPRIRVAGPAEAIAGEAGRSFLAEMVFRSIGR